MLIKKISDLFLTTLDVSTDYQIKEVMDKGALTKEIKLSKSDKSISYLEINAMVNEFEDKNVIMFLKDITERKRIMNELIEAKENAENMNRLKTNFLANMSHELRTPLIGVIGYAEIMRDQTEDSEQKELADTIFASGQRLLRTLNLILDISRLESDKKDIPIIFITAKSEAEDETKGLEIGAADFITKPINPNVVLARVKYQLERKLFRENLQQTIETLAIRNKYITDSINYAKRIQTALLPSEIGRASWRERV